MSTTNRDPQTEAKVADVWRRLETDESFRGQAANDLEGTLRAAGLPTEAISRFSTTPAEPAEAGADVSGYVMCVKITDGIKSSFWCDIKNW